MKATKTKKVMLTATFLTMTACANVDQSNVPPGGDDTGDMGSDMQPTNAGTVTMDPSDFIVDGTTWWTQSAAPRLHGTFDAPSAVTIEVQAGAAPAVTATLTGNEWSVQLAADSITSSNTTVTVTMKATSGAKTELVQTIGLDSAPPAITLLASKVHDERGDQIDFASGEPVHTHAGSDIDLSVGACPSVYKYAYLMSATAPTFGSQTSPNELAWRIKVADAKLDTASEQYRVRSDNGQTVLNWSMLPAADGTGVSTVKLDKDKVPLLATRAGHFYIDVKAKDWSNLETTSTFCFDHHPLQAPLQVKPMQADDLFTRSLPGDATFIAAYAAGEWAKVARQEIVQQTEEPIQITWTPTMSATMSTSHFAGWAEIRNASATYICPAGTTDKKCLDWTPISIPTLNTWSGASDNYWAAIYDVTATEYLQTGPSINLTIPGRYRNDAPHTYVLEIHQNLKDINPSSVGFTGALGVQNLAGFKYVGQPATDLGTACQEIVDGPLSGRVCTKSVTFYNFTAIDHDTVTYNNISATLKLGDQVPGYVSPNAMKLPTMTWDTGDQNIPGSPY